MLTERSLLKAGKGILNVAIHAMCARTPLRARTHTLHSPSARARYRNADLDEAWFNLVGFDAGGGAVESAVRVGLKLRLLRRLAHTRAKAHVRSVKERLRVLGVGVRAELKAKKSAKSKKQAGRAPCATTTLAAAPATAPVATTD